MGATLRGLAAVVATALSLWWHATRIVAAALWRVRWRRGGVYDRAPRDWSRQALAASGIRWALEGALPPAGLPVVYCANHQSVVDVWVLACALPDPVRFVAKRELARMPFLGAAMRASEQVFIDRADPRAAFAAYDRAAAAIRRGFSAIVFPEGTRSRSGALQPFKKGPFVLAIAAQAPVVPVVLAGSWALWPPGRWLPRAGSVTVHVGAPIATAGLGYDDRERLMADCRAALIALGARVDAPPGDG